MDNHTPAVAMSEVTPPVLLNRLVLRALLEAVLPVVASEMSPALAGGEFCDFSGMMMALMIDYQLWELKEIRCKHIVVLTGGETNSDSRHATFPATVDLLWQHASIVQTSLGSYCVNCQ